MMEKPWAKENILTQPSSARPCNADDEYVFELNEDEIQHLLESIDDIMGPENTEIETDINYNQNIHPQKLSNTIDFLQDFEEFEKSCLPACGSGDASIDASILQEFEFFEKTMLPPMDNVDDHVRVSINGGERTEEDIKEMVNEMADDGNETITFIEEEEDVLLTFYFDDDDFNEYDFGGDGSAGGGMDPFLAPQGGTKRVHYIKCSGEARLPPNEVMKRKYRGIIETEEQTTKRLAITKIKNREAATRAHERRREYEACLKSQLQKLNWKNKYLKNFIKFLECHKRKDVQLQVQPLRRTRSGSV